MSRKISKSKKSIVTLIIAIVVVIASFFGLVQVNSDGTITIPSMSFDESYQNDSLVDVDGNLQIHFIDVGQADSILIIQGEHNMLIDAGTNEAGEKVVEYVNSQNIDEFEYVIGTHPHEDHIGGLDNVIENFNIKTLLFPKVTSTTKTFEDVVNIATSKNLKFTAPVVGKIYSLGDATFEILAPNDEKYSSTNNYSIVIKLTYGKNSFLFTGDAEELSEKEILEKDFDVSADLLKIGHHGSNTSTCDEFLDAVNPKYAVICVGQNNTYDHPVKSTMEKLKNNNIAVYRTDEQGDIVATCDGENITFNVDKGSYNYLGDD